MTGELPLYVGGQRIGALIPRPAAAGTRPLADTMSPATQIRVHRGCRGRVHYGGRSNGTSCSRCFSTGIDPAEVEAFDLLLDPVGEWAEQLHDDQLAVIRQRGGWPA